MFSILVGSSIVCSINLLLQRLSNFSNCPFSSTFSLATCNYCLSFFSIKLGLIFPGSQKSFAAHLGYVELSVCVCVFPSVNFVSMTGLTDFNPFASIGS